MYMEDELYLTKKMTFVNEYRAKWEALRTCYKDLLDEGALASGIRYTAHDYKHHCYNIYVNIERFLARRYGVELSPTEIFILYVAVLLHDYIMAVNSEKRATHPQEAFNYIIKSMNEETGNALNRLLTYEEATMVAYVILGHSDLKGEDREINTLEYVAKVYFDKYSNYHIRLPYLAAILRIADELDCTINRLSRPMAEVGLTDKSEDINSAVHFRKLQLIECVSVKEKESNRLILFCNDAVLKEEMYSNDAVYVVEVRNKILRELKKVKKNVLDKFGQDNCPMKVYDDVKIISENVDFQKIVDSLIDAQ